MNPPPDDEIADDTITIVDNPAANRYELRVAGELAAFTTYRLSPGRIVFIHTETLDGFAGHGLATRLARAELDEARARGLRVVPRCPFVAKYIAEHPEYQDLVR
jgi:predicted GNAT family acetyltransferase